jgi:hypothetical protein
VEFVTYVQDVEGQIRCGRRAAADAILLTLQVNPDKRSQGVAVAVEFVPQEYQP